MGSHDATRIAVQRDWDEWRQAEVLLGDLEGIHWLQPARAPRPLIHARVSCTKLLAGEVPHDCHLTPGPHELLVCVLRRHTAPDVYEELQARAGELRMFTGPSDAAAVPAADKGGRRAVAIAIGACAAVTALSVFLWWGVAKRTVRADREILPESAMQGQRLSHSPA